MTWQSETRAWAIAVTAVFCLGSIGYRVMTAPKLPDLAPLTLAVVNTVATINKQVPVVAQDVHATATSLATTADAATGTLSEVRAELKPLVKQATGDLQESHSLILEAALTAKEARQASTEERAALPVITAKTEATIDSLNKEFEALQLATQHADALVSDPNIKGAIAHVDGTAGDIEQQVHKWTHPGIWAKIKGFSLDVAHVFNPL